MIKSNSDFPQIIINSIPAQELVKTKTSKRELAPYFAGLKELDLHEPNFIIMACNTIHLFHRQLQEQTSAPIIDLPFEVEQFLLAKRIKKIAVLGTPLTVNSGLFDFAGIESLKPTKKELLQISKAVFFFNNGTKKQMQIMRLEKIARKYCSHGGTLLLACTEISLMLNGFRAKKIDTLDLMVNAVLKRL